MDEQHQELPAVPENQNQNVQNHQQQRRNQRLQQNVEALMHLANNNVIHALGGQFLIRNSKLLDIALRLPPLFLMDQVSSLLSNSKVNSDENYAGAVKNSFYLQFI